MQLLLKSCRSFSLNFTALKPEVTTTGRHNYNIYANPTINGYLTNNSQNNMHTVIMIHEWWGFNESITHTAETFSNTNIRVFVPDLFRSEAANSAEQAGHKMQGLDWPKAINELNSIREHFQPSSSSVSVMGFCMGGALTLAALTSIPNLKAGGVFYGVPDLNIFRLQNITARAIAHFGVEDPLKGFSDNQTAQKLRSDCENGGIPLSVHSYQGASHAFCNQDSLYYNEEACKEAFRMTQQLIEA